MPPSKVPGAASAIPLIKHAKQGMSVPEAASFFN